MFRQIATLAALVSLAQAAFAIAPATIPESARSRAAKAQPQAATPAPAVQQITVRASRSAPAAKAEARTPAPDSHDGSRFTYDSCGCTGG